MTADLAERMRAELQTPPRGIYPNSAAEGLFLRSHAGAIQRYIDAKARGSVGRPALSQIEEGARMLFAQLLGVNGSDIAFIASTSRGLDPAIKSIVWAPGDNIVLGTLSFPARCSRR